MSCRNTLSVAGGYAVRPHTPVPAAIAIAARPRMSTTALIIGLCLASVNRQAKTARRLLVLIDRRTHVRLKHGRDAASVDWPAAARASRDAPHARRGTPCLWRARCQ